MPIIFPWFGAREGFPSHGFARVTEWEWEESSAAPDGSVTLRFRLPSAALAAGSPSENVTFAVTVSDKLTVELTVANPSRSFRILHVPNRVGVKPRNKPVIPDQFDYARNRTSPNIS